MGTELAHLVHMHIRGRNVAIILSVDVIDSYSTKPLTRTVLTTKDGSSISVRTGP